MDIFEFAMEKEKLAEDYYRRLRLKTSNKGLSNILTMLADEERKHFDLVQQMRQNAPHAMTDTDVLGNAGVIFRKMRESAESFSVEVTELQLYEKAREIEKQARQFYLEKAEAVTDASHKEIFKKLANEEQKHFVLLESICDFVARPQWFLENAEMYRFDDYVDDAL
ncbi:MAG: ferritin-like domain-containing protein [Planctomycetota bacterium]|jgi:rubrerythrin